MAVRVQTDDFDIAAEVKVAAAGRTDIGAVVTFTGIVRAAGDGADRIDAITLEHYPGMTEAELERIEAAAHQRWPLQSVTIVHRVGRLTPGDNIVLVVTASQHRRAAFEAAEFLMDYLKTDAPFWKMEKITGASSRWVEARDSDSLQRDRWQLQDEDEQS
jgi:molybdopterin synthase catalytic subunit